MEGSIIQQWQPSLIWPRRERVWECCRLQCHICSISTYWVCFPVRGRHQACAGKEGKNPAPWRPVQVGDIPNRTNTKNILEHRRQSLCTKGSQVWGNLTPQQLLLNQETKQPRYRVPQKAETSGGCALWGTESIQPVSVPGTEGGWGEWRIGRSQPG